MYIKECTIYRLMEATATIGDLVTKHNKEQPQSLLFFNICQGPIFAKDSTVFSSPEPLTQGELL